MKNIPQEIKTLEADYIDPESDDYTKDVCREKLILIKNRQIDNTIRDYISELLKKG